MGFEMLRCGTHFPLFVAPKLGGISYPYQVLSHCRTGDKIPWGGWVLETHPSGNELNYSLAPGLYIHFYAEKPSNSRFLSF